MNMLDTLMNDYPDVYASLAMEADLDAVLRRAELS